ncbi:MAG: hypothetical protein V3U65_13965 [Granulosicoccaceae bacterium]
MADPSGNATDASWSVSRVVHSDTGMITLLDPFDLKHHQAEPANWFMRDFAIEDDLQTGRFAAVLTERAGSYKVRVTFGELSEKEQSAAGPVAWLRLRVINRRLLLSGGETWPSAEVDHQSFVYDQRWISVPNADYGVIITALDPAANQNNYVFQLIKVGDMKEVKHAPALPQLVYGEKAAVVGVNAKGVQYNERCADVPSKATWVPLISSTMPIPGAVQTVELPRDMHATALARQQSGYSAAMPAVLARNPQVGSYGFYIKPASWNNDQLQGNAQVMVKTLIRCAVRITDVVVKPDLFQLEIQAIPTAVDSVSHDEKTELMNGFQAWMRGTNDMAWQFKTEMVQRSASDGAMVLGILEYLNLSAKESEILLPMSNALRVDYLLDRLRGFSESNPQ